MFLTELQALADDVAHRLGSPAVLEDEEQRIIAYSSQDAPIDEVRRESILHRSTRPEIQEWFRRFGIVASTEPLRIPADHTAGILARVCFPIRYHGLLLGHLWLIDDEHRLNDDDLSIGTEAARHAGLLMYEEVLARRQADSIVGYLLSPSEELRALAAARAAEGALIEPGSSIAVGVALIHGNRSHYSTTLGEALRDFRRGRPRSEFLALAYPDHAVLLCQARSDRRASARAVDGVQTVARVVRAQLGEADNDRDAQIVLGVGDPQTRPYDSYTSYRQARMAARAAMVLPELEGFGIWSRLGIFRTLTQLPGPDAIQEAIDPRVVTALEEIDVPVLLTVEKYLDHAADARTTVAELHLSRGTLYYRLHKVEQASGLDLRDGSDRTSLHLGLKLARFAGCHPAAPPDRRAAARTS